MRVTRGKLTRRLPRATPGPGDVRVVKTCYCGQQPDGFFVADAFRDDPDGGLLHRTRTFNRRREAVAAAWALLADGGRLLDAQRNVTAEQPYLWRVRLRRELIPAEDRGLFARGKRGERQLIDALAAWAGLPTADARTLARLAIAHGEAVYPLTQTESRLALVPFEQREGLTRRVLSAWALLHVEPAEVLPAPLRATSSHTTTPTARGPHVPL